jgi:hypothetical protein
LSPASYVGILFHCRKKAIKGNESRKSISSTTTNCSSGIMPPTN